MAWFGARAGEHLGAFASVAERAALDGRIAAAAGPVAGGEDVAEGWWLTGQRFLAVHLVACSPHRLRPERACPLTGPAPA